MLRVGVVGICGFGRYHAEAFEEVGCKVVAVADVADEVETWASRYSATAYRDYLELLRHNGLDAVSLSLPPRLHPEAIRACAKEGLPVFCEKPVAPSLEEAKALLTGLGSEAKVAVGFCFRCHPAYLRLRELIQNGKLGRVRTVSARKCGNIRTPWRLEEGGGAVFVKDIHYFDLVPWLLDDEPTRICAQGGAFYHDSPVEDSYHLLMGFSRGAIFHLESAWWTLPIGVSSFEVVGDRARVVVEDDALRLIGNDTCEERVKGEGMVTAEIRAFMRWLGHAGPRPPGLLEAVRASRYAQRVVDALKEQR